MLIPASTLFINKSMRVNHTARPNDQIIIFGMSFRWLLLHLSFLF